MIYVICNEKGGADKSSINQSSNRTIDERLSPSIAVNENIYK